MRNYCPLRDNKLIHHSNREANKPHISSVLKNITDKCIAEFYVLLTVHLGSVLVNNQLDALFIFFFVYIYSSSLHVSSIPVLIIKRINCINTTSGIYM